MTVFDNQRTISGADTPVQGTDDGGIIYVDTTATVTLNNTGWTVGESAIAFEIKGAGVTVTFAGSGTTVAGANGVTFTGDNNSAVAVYSGTNEWTIHGGLTASTFLTAANNLSDVASAATARTNLGVDAAGTDNSTNVTLAGTPDYITLAGQVITRGQIDLTADVTGDLPVADGGTGASTAAAARTNLGVDAAGTDNSTDVTLAGTPDYITISGQEITRGQIDLTADVTGDLPLANLAQATATDTFLARDTAGAGDWEEVTAANARTILNVEDGADVTDATNVNAAGAVMESDVDAKGDLYVATAADTVTRLAVGTNDQVLTADSAEASGVKWAAAAGGATVVAGGYGLEHSPRIAPWVATANSSTVGKAAPASDTLGATYTWFAEEMSIDSVDIYVGSSVASSVLRMGIYEDDAGSPGTLLGEGDGTADCSANGVKTVTFTGVTAGPGQVWVAFVDQGGASQPGFRGGDVNGSAIAGGFIESASLGVSNSTKRKPALNHNASVAGALPATFVPLVQPEAQHVWWLMTTSAP